MKEKSIALDPVHGLAPVMCVCAVCGEENGEIALLGSGVRKLTDHKGKRITDDSVLSTIRLRGNLCDRCQSAIDDGGVLLWEAVKDPTNPEKGTLVEDGSCVIITKNGVEPVFGELAEQLRGKTIGVPLAVITKLTGQEKENGNE